VLYDKPNLKEFIASIGNCICSPQIEKYSWKSKTFYVFSVNNNRSTLICDTEGTFFNKEGDRIDFTTAEALTFYEEAKFINTYWKCQSTNADN
jgi:hypothetical protein